MQQNYKIFYFQACVRTILGQLYCIIHPLWDITRTVLQVNKHLTRPLYGTFTLTNDSFMGITLYLRVRKLISSGRRQSLIAIYILLLRLVNLLYN